MSTKTQTLAKSLHTVSVLVSVAQALVGTGTLPDQSAVSSVAAALRVLGYADAADPHGLAAKAVAILEAGK